MSLRPRIHLIAAARPNFMKVAPLWHALKAQNWCEVRLVHTGQHYDPQMSQAFFDDLRLPPPDFNLEVGSGTHAEQTGGVMIAYEKVCLQERPDWIVVVGDVNSTAACALVGAKLWIPVIHLEAGLRSRDRSMPEEINRLVTDSIADVLWTPSADADENLRAEGVAPERIERIGNIMIDSYEMLKPRIVADTSVADHGLVPGEYGVVTLHRPANVDARPALTRLLTQLMRAAQRAPLIFPVHPRTRKRLEEFGLWSVLAEAPGVRLAPALPYVEFMNLVLHSRFVLTDSGGVQEETSYLGIPCVTLRDTTERPITVSSGTNRLTAIDAVEAAVCQIVDGHWPRGSAIPMWDGQAAQRAVAHLRRLCDVERLRLAV